MLDTRRLGLPGLEGWEIDARCRVFPAGSYDPIENEWPYVTIEHHDLVLSFQVAEAAALAFLGDEGCSDVYRELFSENVRKGHSRTKAIALERGISEWIVIAAARRHHSQFEISVLLQKIRWGRIDAPMRLQDIRGGTVGSYDVYPVERQGQRDGSRAFAEMRDAVYDHVMSVDGHQYRLRQMGRLPVAIPGDVVDFKYRLGPKGQRYVVRTSFARSLPESPPEGADGVRSLG